VGGRGLPGGLDDLRQGSVARLATADLGEGFREPGVEERPVRLGLSSKAPAHTDGRHGPAADGAPEEVGERVFEDVEGEPRADVDRVAGSDADVRLLGALLGSAYCRPGDALAEEPLARYEGQGAEEIVQRRVADEGDGPHIRQRSLAGRTLRFRDRLLVGTTGIDAASVDLGLLVEYALLV